MKYILLLAFIAVAYGKGCHEERPAYCAANKDKCQIWESFMRKVCPRTCGFCLREDEDEVANAGCYEPRPDYCAKHIDMCKAPGFVDYMKKFCPRTCGYCLREDEPVANVGCHEEKPAYCAANKDKCQIWESFMRKVCPRTCGFCLREDEESNLKCDIACPRILRPVCGSDGKTYSNRCELRAAACRAGKAIVLVRQCKCKSKDDGKRCAIRCKKISRPVCGSDGKRYENECLMRVASCKQNVAIAAFRPASKEACSDCTYVCGAVFRPICGSDGKTYASSCMMGHKMCEGKSAIVKVYKGECKA